jgi:NAD(P)-dependent dehydrogenase (short-subunit alcohol dehydrogenase family)
MAREGAHLAINFNQSETAAQNLCVELRKLGVRAYPIQADVTKSKQVSDLVDSTLTHYGHIDILVNNVGPYVDTPFIDLKTSDFDSIISGNLRSSFLMCQRVGKLMVERGHGQIINIAATDYKNRSHSVYGLAKAGVIYLTEAFALELAPEVRIHAVAPDLIADNEDMSIELVNQATAATPMGRLVTRDEIARVVSLLCTEPFAMSTGQTVILDGGRSIPRIANGTA